MTSPSDRLKATVAKVATIAQATRDAADAARRALAETIEREATGREEVPSAGSGTGDQATR